MRELKKIPVLVLIILAQFVNAQTESGIGITEFQNIDPYKFDVQKLNSINVSEFEPKAYLAYMQKDYTKALKYYLYIASYNVDDVEVLYKISCCYAWLDQASFASDFLAMAVNRGYANFSQIEKEEAFDLIKNDQVFAQILTEIYNYGKNYGKIEYVQATKLIRCRVLLPDSYDASKVYPVIIGLHGYGDRSEQFCQLYSHLNSPEFIFVVPEAPYIIGDGLGYVAPQYSWDFVTRDEELMKKADPDVIRYIENVISHTTTNYQVGDVYLMGFSQGVAYSYATAIKNPDLVKGLICFAGTLPDPDQYKWLLSEEEISNGKDVKVYIVHGKEDKAIRYKESIEARKILKKAGYNVELSLFEGGHYVPVDELEKAISWHISNK